MFYTSYILWCITLFLKLCTDVYFDYVAMYLSVLLVLHYGSLQSNSAGSFSSRFENKLFADSPLSTDRAELE